jgi:hypothetical protein
MGAHAGVLPSFLPPCPWAAVTFLASFPHVYPWPPVALSQPPVARRSHVRTHTHVLHTCMHVRVLHARVCENALAPAGICRLPVSTAPRHAAPAPAWLMALCLKAPFLVPAASHHHFCH